MAMWPFRRKGSRRRSRKAAMDTSNLEDPGRGRQDQPPPRTQTEPASSKATASNTRDGTSSRPQRRGRAYSFSPGRQDSLRVAKLRKRSTVQGPGSLPNVDIAMRAPTLHHDTSRNKRSGQPLLHKKSSKRRKEDHDREAEIKAMSQFMPTRPATDSWTAGRPMKRESRQFRLGLGGSADHPSSDISLPFAESIHSAMSSDSEGVSWKVSALDALAPRPTLRYASNPIMSSGPGSGPARSQSTRKRITGQAVPESTLRAHRRIHDLADDLDASDLRELMERDKRRRERKIEEDRERAERRLARRAEKQRAEEVAAAHSGTLPPANLERGVLGREIPDSGGDRTSAIVTSSRRRSSSHSGRRSRHSSQAEELENREKTPSPLDEFYRTDSIPPAETTSEARASGSAVAPKQTEFVPASSSSPRIFGFIRKKSRSNSPTQPEQPTLARVHTPPAPSVKFDDGESVSRTSDSRSSRPWLSLFKWGKNRRSSGPSSFSNTSRDSMLGGSQQVPPTNYIPPRKASSGVPKRTMSRFREDLPELPISPPDSRVGSPECEPIPVEPLPVITDDVAMRYDTPIEAHRYPEAMRATPISIPRDEVQPSPAPHSMSLASIDSEASWLSGRIRKRTSSGMRTSLQYPPRTVSALSGGSGGQDSEHTEDENIVDDEYLNSVVPSRLRRLSTGEARPSSDEEDESSPKWGAVGQTPTFMQHRDTMRSQEGLLQSFDNEKELGNANESEDDGDGQSPVEPQRATSISLGRNHARNFSAGSAKLFELSPRPSVEHRRSGIERNTQ